MKMKMKPAQRQIVHATGIHDARRQVIRLVSVVVAAHALRLLILQVCVQCARASGHAMRERSCAHVHAFVHGMRACLSGWVHACAHTLYLSQIYHKRSRQEKEDVALEILNHFVALVLMVQLDSVDGTSE